MLVVRCSWRFRRAPSTIGAQPCPESRIARVAWAAVSLENIKLSETLDQRCRGIVDQHHGRRFPAGELLLDAQHDGRRSEGGEATNGRAVHQAPLRQLVVANRKVLAPAVVPHQQVADLPAMGVDHFVAHD